MCFASIVALGFANTVSLISSIPRFRSANMSIKTLFVFTRSRNLSIVSESRFQFPYLNISNLLLYHTYKINGEKAVHLNPRPQAKDAKPSTKSKTGAACEVCGRYLQDPPNRFCSIACKVSAVDLKPKDLSHKLEVPVQEFPHHLSWKDNQNSEEKKSSVSSADVSVSEETKMWVSTSLKPRKGMNKRKGIPHRSPFS
ncbi:hypothetical protein V6N11_007873 [Hibiscus sabdariffa]|uniref:PLATZ transcription factor family protein n=1 Tax=Hibiscus sabdariffa TaxID=183260 RepID=A0ABR2PZG5_9ROSI